MPNKESLKRQTLLSLEHPAELKPSQVAEVSDSIEQDLLRVIRFNIVNRRKSCIPVANCATEPKFNWNGMRGHLDRFCLVFASIIHQLCNDNDPIEQVLGDHWFHEVVPDSCAKGPDGQSFRVVFS